MIVTVLKERGSVDLKVETTMKETMGRELMIETMIESIKKVLGDSVEDVVELEEGNMIAKKNVMIMKVTSLKETKTAQPILLQEVREAVWSEAEEAQIMFRSHLLDQN